MAPTSANHPLAHKIVRKIVHKIVKVLLIALAVIVGLPLLVAALLYVPPIQNWAVKTACSMVSRSTGMEISLSHIALRFPLDLQVDSVLVKYNPADTMARAAMARVRVAPLPLLKGDIALSAFRAEQLFYQLGTPDSALWLRARVRLASLDHGNMNFKRGAIDVGDARVEGARVMLAMKDTVIPAEPDTAAVKPLRITASTIRLSDVDYLMTLPPVIDMLRTHVDHASLEQGLVDLADRRIRGRSLRVEGVRAAYLHPAVYPAAETDTPADSVAPGAPYDPSEMWLITADTLSLTAPHALYAATGASPLPGFDPDYIEASEVEFLVTDFMNRGVEISVPLRAFHARERCGITLDGDGLFTMDTLAMQARDFHLRTAHSRLALSARMGMGDMAADPALPLSLRAEGVLSGADAALFMPAAAPMVKALPAPRSLLLDLDAGGTAGLITLRKARMQLPGVLTLSAAGDVRNAMDFDRIGGAVTFQGAVRDPAAVRHTLTALRIDPSLTIPALALKGKVDYSPGNADGSLSLTTGGGSLLADGKWNARREGYSASLSLTSFPVDAFMPALGMGRITAKLRADGRGFNPFAPSTQADIDLDLQSAEYAGHLYTDALLQASLRGGSARGLLSSSNPNADLTLRLDARMDSGLLHASLNGDVRDLNLMRLGLMDVPCHGSLMLEADGTYNPRNADVAAKMDLVGLCWQLDTLMFMTPSLALSGESTTSHVAFSARNLDFSADALMEAPLDTIMRRLPRLTAVAQRQLKERSVDVRELQALLPPLVANARMRGDNLISRYLSETAGLSVGDALLNLHNDSLFHAHLSAGAITTGSTDIDTVALDLNQHGKFLVYNAMMKNAPGSSLAEWADVTLRGYMADDKLAAFANQYNQQGEQGYRLGFVATLADSLVTVRFSPAAPTIAYKKWSLNPDNYFSFNYVKRQIDADIALSGAGSSLRLYTSPLLPPNPDYSPKELIVEARDIHIADWLAISPFAPPMAGDVSADLRIHREQTNLVGTALVQVNGFSYDRKKVGDFALNLDVSNNKDTRSLWAKGALSIDGRETMTINGALNDTTATNPFLLDFSMIHFPLEVANPFLPQGTASLSGTLNGTMKITGSGSRPIFDGYLQFDSAAVTIPMLGSSYRFSPDRIPVDSNTVRFNNFPIFTLNDNPLSINGTTDLTDLSNVAYDITLSGNNMLMVNSNRARGADIYGKGFLSLDASARGNMRWLSCNANVTLLAGSNITYVLTSAATGAIASQNTSDMVKFVSFADSLQVAQADSVARSMNLFLDATLSVENNTTVNVDISTDGKNRAQVQGYGDLNFTMNPSNDGRLVGRYTIENGFVRYTPPLMSEKNFKFESGSYVSFNGNMLNPILSIHAVDQMRANVTPEGGGNSRLVNFDVGLSVTGTLDRMQVAFNLATDDDITIQNELQSMSPDQRANQAMNLLLYNTYTGPGTKANSNLSGNPLYAFLASQLNSLTANVVKGVDLTFGIDQYKSTYNGSTGTATTYSYQISKSLLDNRIRIIVGGNYSTDANTDENFAENLVNDISFEYLLNRSGSMYVRVFRHADYESILEGEIIATGVGFVYKRNLLTLRDMFRFGSRRRRDDAKTSSPASPDSPSSPSSSSPQKP